MTLVFNASLASINSMCDTHAMNTISEIHELALKLPPRSRLKLAGELLRSVTTDTSSREFLDEARRRDNEINSGKVSLLKESEFWSGIAKCRRRP
jgi:hypothetical protein